MTIEELKNSPDFELIETLAHSDIKPFIARELKGNQGFGLIAKMYQGISLLLFGFALIKAFAFYMKNKDTIMLEYLGWGTLFSFTAIIVIHELLHFFGYLAVGAKRISFGMKLKKFIFYVQADQQVFSYKRFAVVALVPAVVVAVCSIAGAIIWFEQPLYYFFISIFCFHSLFCAGDLGMLCYFENRPEDEIYTFDVKAEGKTYYYKRTER